MVTTTRTPTEMPADSDGGAGARDAWLPALLQLSDSTLPIGAYAHSFGFEGLVQLGAIRDEAELERFLKRELLGALEEVDLPLLRHQRAALAERDLARLVRLDALALATRPSAELRSASQRMGRQLQLLGPRLAGGDAAASRDWAEIAAALPAPQAVTMNAVLHHFRGIPVEAGLASLAWQALSGVAQAGLKLLHLGPSAIQGILGRCGDAIAASVDASACHSEDDIGSFAPLWDIASARHERAPARLFIS